MRLPRMGLMPALWIGLVAGLLEVLVRACQHFVLGRLVFVGVDYWWAAPLLTALLVAVPAVLLGAPLARALPLLGPLLRYGLPLFFALFGLLLLIPKVAAAAVALLAAGLAYRGGRWLVLHEAGFDRVVRRSLAVLLLLPALGGAGLHLSQRARNASLSSAAPGAPGPNVLLIILDTVRAIEFGVYGSHPTMTPNLDGLATSGVTFDQAYSAAPWTAPSHASLFTGRHPQELSIDWKSSLDRTFPTLAEALRDGGYATVGIVANVEYAAAETGLARGFSHYEDRRLSLAEAVQWTGLSRKAARLVQAIARPAPADLPGRVNAPDINRRFLRWIDRRPSRPFFAFLNYFDAHAPYFPPEPYWSRQLPDEPRAPLAVAPGGWSPPRVNIGRRAYQGAIAYLDGQIAALLDSLRLRGLLKETLVVVASDHGEEFFEHGLMGHGNSLYVPSVRVPLILIWPGHLPAGVRVAEPVSLTSLPATILEIVGRNGSFPAPSLAGYWSGHPPAPATVVSAVTFAGNLPAWYPVSGGTIESGMLGRYRYIWSARDSLGELYNHASDPQESRNLAREPGSAAMVAALRDSLLRIPSLRPRPRR